MLSILETLKIGIMSRFIDLNDGVKIVDFLHNLIEEVVIGRFSPNLSTFLV
jgi:hemerythrin-like domain-containing protein